MTKAQRPYGQRTSASSQRGSYIRGNTGEVTLENVTLGKETEKAILATVNGEDHWIPLSQISKIERSPNKGEDKLVVSLWIAEQKGLA